MNKTSTTAMVTIGNAPMINPLPNNILNFGLTWFFGQTFFYLKT